MRAFAPHTHKNSLKNILHTEMFLYTNQIIGRTVMKFRCVQFVISKSLHSHETMRIFFVMATGTNEARASDKYERRPRRVCASSSTVQSYTSARTLNNVWLISSCEHGKCNVYQQNIYIKCLEWNSNYQRATGMNL